MFPSGKDKRMCNKYDVLTILFHECLFYLLGFRLPFNDFEVGVEPFGIFSFTTSLGELGTHQGLPTLV